MTVPLNTNEAFAIRVYIIMYLGGHAPDTLICINDMSHPAVTVAIALARAQAPHVILLSDVPGSYLTRRYI